MSNLTIGTGTSRRNHHVRQPAPGEPPRRCCLPDSEYGFDGALSLRLFLFWLPSSQPRLPASASRLLLLGSLAPQLVSARCYCHKPAAATARRGPARGGRGREPGPGESTWDVHRCPAHCTACDAGGPSEAGRRHEQRDFCVDLTPASPVSKAPTWGRLGPVLLTVLIDRIQLALRLTSLVTI